MIYGQLTRTGDHYVLDSYSGEQALHLAPTTIFMDAMTGAALTLENVENTSVYAYIRADYEGFAPIATAVVGNQIGRAHV